MSALRRLLVLLFSLLTPMVFAGEVFAADNPLSIPAITLSTDAEGQQEYSVSLQILLIMTALSFIPAFVMLMTSFTRIVIVLGLLRTAIGTQSAPPNQVLQRISNSSLQLTLLAVWRHTRVAGSGPVSAVAGR